MADKERDNFMELTKEFVSLSTRTSIALEGLQDAIKDMNDNNVLHANAINRNTEAIKVVTRFWGWIVSALVLAIIVLAGAEKILPYIGKMP